ncbi:MAG: hypothetical protein HYZ36_09040 [Pedosphaera parvula]|nr:hypothetical protein [Pedosphaera parvula]
MLAFSAERIKQALYRVLPISDEGGTMIYLNLVSTRSFDQPVTVISGLYRDGWQYGVDTPDQVEPIKLIRAIVQILLLERANRTAGGKSSEIPLWLTEGLTVHLAALVGPNLVVPSIPTGFMLRTMRNLRGLDPLEAARPTLKSEPALTFDDLASPPFVLLTADGYTTFQASAHLFVAELLHLQHGPENLVKMLDQLPRFWNWQLAFLRAFHEDFSSMLQVEKWWSLRLVAFTGRDASRVWTPELCLRELAEILTASAEVRTSTNTLPIHTEVTLQQMIMNWNFDWQKPVLRQKLVQLANLRVNSPLGVVAIIDRYRQTLESYLRSRSEAENAPDTKLRTHSRGRILGQQTAKRLDDLDKQRRNFQELTPSASSTIGARLSPAFGTRPMLSDIRADLTARWD